jgi:hypothetical protein
LMKARKTLSSTILGVFPM